jgi:hypothetical protein
MADALLKRRWFRFTPGYFLAGLLAVEGTLLAIHWLGWFHKGYGVLVALAAVGMFLILMLVWWLAALIFRLRFQFSIRSLLVLTLAVALPCSWLATEMKRAREQREQAEWIVKEGGRVSYDYERDSSGNDIPNAQPPGPAWLRSLLGDDFFTHTVAATLSRAQVTNAGLEHLKALSQLQWLSLYRTRVTDAGLEHLKRLSQLQELDLGNTQVTDAGLEHLKGLSQLRSLSLDGTPVTDAGLERLKRLSQLQELHLYGTHVTNTGLEHLKGLSRLQRLFLASTHVTDAGLEHLKGLSQLQELDLRNTRVTDAGLEHLKSLSQLQELFLGNTQVTDAGVNAGGKPWRGAGPA